MDEGELRSSVAIECGLAKLGAAQESSISPGIPNLEFGIQNFEFGSKLLFLKIR